MSRTNDENFADRLKRLIETIDVANMLTEPLTGSIRNLLEISSKEIGSGEASVLVRDGDRGELRFLMAIGQVADQLLNLRVPAGKGIAGFVFSSGQPMAVSDVGEEESFYDEVDKKTGYSTQMILATPLRHNGEIIGVLEYINRPGEPPFDPFTPDEMDKAAFYAEAIGAVVSAYESAKVFRDLGDDILADENRNDAVAMQTWLGQIRASVEHKDMIELAYLVREIAIRGEAERQLCRDLLESIVKFSDATGDTSYLG